MKAMPRKNTGGSAASAKTLKPYVARVREDAIRDFAERYPDLQFAPAVVVIAAYDEEGAVGGVLEAVPAEACGIRLDTLVIDDGSSDETTAESLARGAHVATLSRNCGHGVALRLGYQLARDNGAQYIVTMDADGEWDPADIPGVLQPVVDGQADFVIGSRVLGHDEGDDAVRRAGVRVFALVIRLLTGVKVTDTSSAVRAMRSEVTATVRQEQVQYQTSELLIGAIGQGYRVVERPVSHHLRAAGESKKGTSIMYGWSYTRVIVKTWWREKRARRGRNV